MDIDFSNMWCWLLPLLCTLLGALFGYFLGKSGNTTVDHSADLKLWKDKNAKLQADLDACNKKLSSSNSGGSASSSLGAAGAGAGAVGAASSLTASTPEPESIPEPVVETSIPFDAAAASAAFGKTIKVDDLKIVEGIGPKISEMFQNAGIATWKALSETSVADCQKVLDTGGDRYKVHDPASWPLQAKMAYQGKWADLVKWQDEHDHGRL